MTSLRNDLVELIERSALEPESVLKAVELAQVKPSSEAWVRFLNALFVWVGAVSFGLAVIFFFAYNWSEMGKFAKFALIEVSLVVSVSYYALAKKRGVLTQASAFLSSILVGALLALFGQTYQTGADTWQLFATWMLFITPWVVVARQASVWCLWLGLANVAIALYLATFSPLSFLFISSHESMLWSLFLFNTSGLFLWQMLSQTRSWMRNTWTTRLLAVAAGGCSTSLVWLSIIDMSPNLWGPVVAWLCFLGSIYYCYRKLSVDLFMLAGICLSCIVIVTTFVALHLQDADELGYFLFLALLVICLGLISAKWLRAVQQGESCHGE